MKELGRVLVTGATGFVGSAIVRAFLAAGYPVRALVRAASPRGNLAGLEIETIEGDILDVNAIAHAMSGVTSVAHAAGGDRQSIDADRSAGRQAHAHRADHRCRRLRAHARVRGHRTESRACR